MAGIAGSGPSPSPSPSPTSLSGGRLAGPAGHVRPELHLLPPSRSTERQGLILTLPYANTHPGRDAPALIWSDAKSAHVLVQSWS